MSLNHPDAPGFPADQSHPVAAPPTAGTDGEPIPAPARIPAETATAATAARTGRTAAHRVPLVLLGLAVQLLAQQGAQLGGAAGGCLLYTSPSPRD